MDDDTLRFYRNNAEGYAQREITSRQARRFLARLPPGLFRRIEGRVGPLDQCFDPLVRLDGREAAAHGHGDLLIVAIDRHAGHRFANLLSRLNGVFQRRRWEQDRELFATETGDCILASNSSTLSPVTSTVLVTSTPN